MLNKKQQRMMKDPVTRRNFLTASAAGTAAGFAALADPGTAAAQSVGVKKADLPDLTVKQVKVYVTDTANIHRLNSGETGEIVSVVTASGIEGNYTLGNRNRTAGWLEWAKATLVGNKRSRSVARAERHVGNDEYRRTERPPAHFCGPPGAARQSGSAARDGKSRSLSRPHRNMARLQGLRRGHLSLGHPRQSRQSPCLPAPRRQERPHDGLREFAAPGRYRRLRARRAESQGAGIPRVQDPSRLRPA
jgi:hypothetical protein